MWRFKPFMQKEQTGLEGRVIDISNFKVQIRNVIAEGGFSCVYLARDAIHGSKQYALKHIICNDEESQELVMKEILVMKKLKGHPNVVTLHAHAMFDMGRTREAFLLMEYCEKSLVNVLDSRGSAGFFEEKQVITIFRDVCNAVFAMHCQVPPIAHRDLKAENLLLGSDGLWKLCDFGSTSTNHKRFERPEEMGIEEDNIRKYTTPAYRAPEMWDLFRRELINEKVDIWALGCLLFRICYLKSAFDGESKLQILNGNYRIPDLPKYNTVLTDLIRDMLQSSPNDRPDITQVWFRVNNLLPDGLQKSLPDSPPEMPQNSADVLAGGDTDIGTPKPSNKSSPMPRRNPPPPPSSEASRNVSSASSNQRTGESTGPLGAFWTTQHAKDSEAKEDKTRPKYDQETTDRKSTGNEKIRPEGRPTPHVTPTSHNDAFNAFVAEFNNNIPSPSNNHKKPEKEEMLEAEVEKLREQLAHATSEKAEITSKYEKLSAICRSQRQEIQELKHALAMRTPSPSRDSSRTLASPQSHSTLASPQSHSTLASPQSYSSTNTLNDKIEGTVWELQQGLFDGSSKSTDSQQWQAFADDPKAVPTLETPKSVRTRNGQQNSRATGPTTSGANTWGFETDSFKVVPAASSKISAPVGELNSSQRFGAAKSSQTKSDVQPAGWAGF